MQFNINMSGFDLSDVAYIKAVDESSIVTDGMVMFWDAGNRKSFIGGGITVRDLSGKGNHGTWNTTVRWNSYYGGVFQFAASGGITSGINLVSGKSTIIAASRYTAGTHARVISSVSNNWLFGHHGNGCVRWYSEGWVVQDGPDDNNWRIYEGTIDTVADVYTLYVNGTFYISNANGSQGPNGISLGYSAANGEPSNCEVGFIILYNRVLTIAELLKNYNAMKGRYALN